MYCHLSKPVSVALRLAAIWVLFIGVAACSPVTPDPKPPLYAPIALTQEGSTAEFEFWAYPKDSHEKNVLMVGLRLKRNWDGLDDGAANTLFRKVRAAKIRVKLTSSLNGESAQFKSYSDFESPEDIRFPPTARLGAWDVQAYNFSHDGEYDNFYLAGLSRQEGGKYKVKVEVVEPNMDVEGMQAEVFVAFRLFGGK